MKPIRRRNWTIRDWMLLLLTLGVGCWAHRQPLADIVDIGLRDSEQSHIFLAPIIAAWLVWLRRSRIRYIQYSPSLLGPAIALGGWILSWWGFHAGMQVAWHAGAVLTLLGVVIGFTGVEVVRQFSPAVLVLAAVLPVPGFIRQTIAIPLQGIATTVTHGVLETVGVAAQRSGSILIINGEQVAVGEACNGMRMVFALTLVVYAFAFGTPLRPGTRALLLILSPLTALVANVIRLVPTSLFYGYATSERAQWFHDLAGWVMLPVSLVLLLGLLRLFNWLEFPVTRYRLASQA